MLNLNLNIAVLWELLTTDKTLGATASGNQRDLCRSVLYFELF